MTERTHDPREDELLVVRCQLGERTALEELTRRWHGPLWNYVRRLTRSEDEARDVAQDAWLRILRGVGRLQDGRKLRPWLFGITRRALMDRLRQRYAQSVEDELDERALELPQAPDDPEPPLAALEEGLSQLPLLEQEVLTLVYLREMSLAEVSEVLDVPVGTVKSRLFRARHLLRQALRTKGI